MENFNQNFEPQCEVNAVNTQETDQPKKLCKGLKWLIFLMFASCALTLYSCLSNCQSLMWFDFKLTPWMLAEVVIISLLVVSSIVALVRRSSKAISLLQSTLIVFIIGKAVTILITLFVETPFEYPSILSSVVAIAIALSFLLFVTESDDCQKLFPEATRKRSKFGLVLVVAFVIVEAVASMLMFKHSDDPASFFTSDRVFIEANIKELNKQSVNAPTVALDGTTLLIEINENVHVPYGYELQQPTEYQLQTQKREIMDQLTVTKEDKYLVSLLVRNNYSVLVKYNVNNIIKYDISISAQELEEWLY